MDGTLEALIMKNHELEDLRLLPNGDYAAVRRFLFTWAIMTGIDDTGYRERWCYETEREARAAFKYFDGSGDPLGMWIVHKGVGGDRPNPRRSS